MVSPIVVVGAVFERDGRVLACRRAPGKTDAGLWEFPGGKVEPGETHEDALAREIREELGVEVTVGALINRSTTLSGTKSIDLATFVVTPASGFPTESSDHDELCWVARSELSSLDWATPDRPTVAALLG